MVSNSRIAHMSCQICRKSWGEYSASSSSVVFEYAFTGMPANSMVSLANTFSGSIMIDFGIPLLMDRAKRFHIFNVTLEHLQESSPGRAVNHLVIASQRQADGIGEFDAPIPPHRLQ